MYTPQATPYDRRKLLEEIVQTNPENKYLTEILFRNNE